MCEAGNNSMNFHDKPFDAATDFTQIDLSGQLSDLYRYHKVGKN